jgi:hypothetical protein
MHSIILDHELHFNPGVPMKTPKLTAKAHLATTLLSGALSVSILYSLPARAEGGADVGGGNGSPAKIVRITATGLDALADQGDIVINGRKIDIKAMQDALANLKEIRPTDKELPAVNGKPVCLINHPGAKALDMNVPCFDSYDEDTKLQMGFHEVWGLAFNDKQDDTYFFSAKLVQKVKNRGPASEVAVSEIVRMNGNAIESISKNEYDSKSEKYNALLQKSEAAAGLNCFYADGATRSQATSAISGKAMSPATVIAQAEGTIRCEIPKPKKLPLLGIKSQGPDEDLNILVTNFTKQGRKALLKAAEEGKVEGAASKACLEESIQNNKEISKDPVLQSLKTKIEEKIGPFSLVYNMTYGLGKKINDPNSYQTTNGPFPGILEVYTSNPEFIQNRKGKIVDFNNLFFEVRKNVYDLNQRAIETKNVDCSVKKEAVKKYLEELDNYLSEKGDELSPEEDAATTSAL